jgi:hypothetical protein
MGWKQTGKPPMLLRGVSVAIVLGGRESRPQGEGPQRVGVSEQNSPNVNRRNLCGCR